MAANVYVRGTDRKQRTDGDHTSVEAYRRDIHCLNNSVMDTIIIIALMRQGYSYVNLAD